MNTTHHEATFNELLSAVRDYGTVCTAWSGDNAAHETACVEAFAAVRRIAERIIEPPDETYRTQLEYLTKEDREGDA